MAKIDKVFVAAPSILKLNLFNKSVQETALLHKTVPWSRDGLITYAPVANKSFAFILTIDKHSAYVINVKNNGDATKKQQNTHLLKRICIVLSIGFVVFFLLFFALLVYQRLFKRSQNKYKAIKATKVFAA